MSELRCVPMREEDLEWVATQEAGIHEHPWSLTNFSDALASGYSCWLLYSDETPVGYTVLMRVLDEAHLLNISILPAWQRQGLGDGLLAHIKAAARSHGTLSMFLEVRQSNALAHGFYLRRSFTEIGRRKGYYPGREGREDAIVMRCEL